MPEAPRILEVADLHVRPGPATAFAGAFGAAERFTAAAPGWLGEARP